VLIVFVNNQPTVLLKLSKRAFQKLGKIRLEACRLHYAPARKTVAAAILTWAYRNLDGISNGEPVVLGGRRSTIKLSGALASEVESLSQKCSPPLSDPSYVLEMVYPRMDEFWEQDDKRTHLIRSFRTRPYLRESEVIIVRIPVQLCEKFIASERGRLQREEVSDAWRSRFERQPLGDQVSLQRAITRRLEMALAANRFTEILDQYRNRVLSILQSGEPKCAIAVRVPLAMRAKMPSVSYDQYILKALLMGDRIYSSASGG
jgi:hypothetical protein